MLPSPLALTDHLWLLRGRKLRLSGALACALLLAAVTAGCGAMSRTSTATPTATATATPAPLPPAPAGVYVLASSTLDVLSLADGTVQSVFPYENPAADVQGYEVTPLVVADGAAYFVTNGALSNTQTVSVPSTVVALRATDGSVLWRFSLPNTPENSNVPSAAFLTSVANGIVYVDSSVNASPPTFYALSAKDGHVLWQVQPNFIRAPATVADDVVYLPVQAQDGTQHLLALRATDGTQIWDFRVPTCGSLDTPAVDNGMVYVSCGLLPPSGVYGVRATDGTLVWHQGSLGNFIGPLVAGNGFVYVSDGGCGPVYYPPCPPIYFYALDAQSGAIRWRIPSVVNFITLTPGALYCYIGPSFTSLTVLDPTTGAVRVSYPPLDLHIQRRESHDTVAGGVQYFEGDEQIFAISLATGKLLWHSPRLVEQSNPTVAIFVVPQAS